MQKGLTWLLKNNEKLDVEEIGIQLSELPNALVGMRIGVVADLHMRRVDPFHYRVYDALRAARPELILIAGDTIDSSTGSVPELTPFFVHLSRLATCVAVLGNNDCGTSRTPQLRALYKEAGIALLENETRMIAVRGGALKITGLTDPEAFAAGVHPHNPIKSAERVSIREALQPGALGIKRPETPSILLMHQPQLAKRYAELAPSLIVAGHAHGGQFRLPLVGGLFAPGQGIFPRLTSGLYRQGSAWMVVSRGLGNHTFPIRLGNPMHLPVLRLEPEKR